MAQETKKKKIIVNDYPEDEDRYEKLQREAAEEAAGGGVQPKTAAQDAAGGAQPSMAAQTEEQEDAKVLEGDAGVVAPKQNRPTIFDTARTLIPQNGVNTQVVNSVPSYVPSGDAVAQARESLNQRVNHQNPVSTQEPLTIQERAPQQPQMPEYKVVSNPQPDYNNPTDNNFLQSVAMMPEDQRNAALAQYLANGGQEAYRDYMSQRRYIEDPQAAAEREKREQRNQRLISAMNMVGALGNFVQAGAQTDGRSVPVANTTEAYDKKLAAEREIRQNNLAKANALGQQYRTMAGGIIKEGYKNIEDRAKLAQQERIAQARIDQQAQATAARVNQWDESNKIARERIAMQEKIAKVRAAVSAAKGSSGGSDMSKTHICLSDGTNTYFVPKNAWQNEAFGQAWSLLPQELKDKAVNAIIQQVSQSDAETNAQMALFKSSPTRFFQMNKDAFRIAIGMMMSEPGAEKMVQFIKSLAAAGGAQNNGGGSGKPQSPSAAAVGGKGGSGGNGGSGNGREDFSLD